MIIMTGPASNKRIDYRQTTFLLEAYHLGKSSISKQEFRAFQDAVKSHNDRAILNILDRYAVSVQYWF